MPTLKVKQKDGFISSVTLFRSTVSPTASILVLHGMAEHCGRYRRFASALNAAGIDVYLYNHRGHGSSTNGAHSGHIADNNGAALLIGDALHIADKISGIKRTDSLFLFGHSMGSLVARNVIQYKDDFEGVILAGTTCPSFLKNCAGLLAAQIVKMISGSTHRSVFLDHLIFGGRKYTSLCKNTSFDWLTTVQDEVSKYMDDEKCGFICSCAFYQDLLTLSLLASRKRRIKRTKTSLPILFLSGADDPVGGYGKEVRRLVHIYRTLGFQNITAKLYPNARHELLHEKNSAEVTAKILDFIEDIIQKSL